jgi:hypothetical protein
MNEGVEGGKRGRVMAGQVQDILPEGDGFQGPGGNFFKPFQREGLFQVFFQEDHEFLQLLLYEGQGMIRYLVVNEGGVQEK